LQTEPVHAAVVRNEHHPARSYQTNIDPVSVRIPEFWSKDDLPLGRCATLARRTKTLEG
jgi:hypothetical protein